MITDYSSGFKIAIFQSVSERQRAKWATIVKFWPSRSTIFTFDFYFTQKLLDCIFTVFLHNEEQLISY